MNSIKEKSIAPKENRMKTSFVFIYLYITLHVHITLTT